MAGTTVTSTLDIRLIDDVSRPAAVIAASLLKMESEAKNVDAALSKSGGSAKMQASLKALGASVTQVEGVTKALEQYARAEGLAADRGSWTKTQADGYRNLEQVAVAATRSMMSQERALASQRAADAVAQERQMRQHLAAQQHDVSQGGFGHYLLGGAAAAVSAHAIMSGIETSVEHGAEYQKELVGLRNAGRTAEEISSIVKTATATLGAVPTSTLIENMRTVAETTTAFGSVEHAQAHLGFLQQASSVLHAAAGNKIEGGPAEVGQMLARYYEERMRPPEEFESEMASMVPAMVASGGNFNPQNLFAFAQQAKGALPGYNLDFLSKYAPSLIAANGGDRAGTAANAFDSVISGKARDKKQAAEWMRLGLLDPKEVIEGKGGVIGWKAGAVKGTDLAMQNPVEWAKQFLIPAMQAKGIDTDNRLAVKKELTTLYRNQNANFWANEITQAQSRKRLEKDAALYDKVGKLQDIYWRNLRQNPVLALSALQGSVQNLMTAVSAPAMPAAANVLSHVAQAVNEVAMAAQRHPASALSAGVLAAGGALYGAGRLGYAVMNGFSGGFGLKTSAHMLDHSAARLEGAASALRGAAVSEGHRGAGGPGGGFHEGTGPGGKSPAINKNWGAWSMLGANMLPIGLDGINFLGMNPDERKAKLQQDGTDAQATADWGNHLVRGLRDNFHLGWLLPFAPDDNTPGEEEPPPHRYPPLFTKTAPPAADGLGRMYQDFVPEPTQVAPTEAEHPGWRFPPTAPAAPSVDPSATDELFRLGSAAQDAGQHLAALNETISPQIATGGLDALIAKLSQAVALQAALGGGGSTAAAGGTSRRPFHTTSNRLDA